ncbi:hypothetical protein GR212_33080 [Rhizobium lusitanum]|uniref:VOC family protein n=1 Tax=Rhizobium lusitanum TaxID=293958 RepID=A0A6L9UKM7_9HYPH|nr:hypothetical protein [Rhizobium lusitanum]NEI74390.1 hypothetical protein [Rhizobium lusitanum]
MAAINVLSRLYVSSIDQGLRDLKHITDAPVTIRFRYGTLELASVGAFLLIAGNEADLAPYRETQATATVENLKDMQSKFEAEGAAVLVAPQDVPTGRNMTVRHAAGAVIEYVQLDYRKLSALPR